MHVGPWSAEVILITDPEHELPVEIERTGLRTIAVGAGDSTSLGLPYLPANADVHVGDVLVTSGLGGVFPPGYPVARVTEVHKDTVQPLAHVRAAPFAHLDTDTEVMLIWFRHDSPAAPLKERNGRLTIGDRSIQPLAVPPKPQAAAKTPAATPKRIATKPAGPKADAAQKAPAPSTKAPLHAPPKKPEQPPT
jgi:rod shape-determining protein MreC